jgi:sialate O-acetylesterase
MTTLLAIAQLAILAWTSATAEPLLHPIFQDHVVLQREQPIRVWGRANPGEIVTVTLANVTASARADDSGRWQTDVPALPAGGPHTLTARTAHTTQAVNDVLIGDVWLCAGQSNMALQVARTLDARSEIANSANQTIRMLTVPLASSPQPLDNFTEAVRWEVAAPATVPNWGATCFYFARELQKAVRVPMGMINAAWGGSNIQTWMSEAALRAIPGYATPLDALRLYATDQPAAVARWGEVWMNWWRKQRSTQPWAAGARSAQWQPAPAALTPWESWGVPELTQYNGMVWYRTDVVLTPAQAKQSATLAIGAVDEVDATWLNGVFVGSTSDPGRPREYAITAGQLRAGPNAIVVNALDTYAAGGMYGPAEKRVLRLGDGTAIPLSSWHYQIAAGVQSPPRTPWEATGGLTTIRNAMIAPIAGYTLRGALWYQGESNTGRADQYQRLLSGLMADWRASFSPRLPFLIVQLAGYGAPPTKPVESGWAALRDAQRLTVLADGNAGLAVAIDIGDRYDIHPANKQELGRRLARAARRVVYGEKIAASGPAVVSARRVGDDVEVTFTDITGRLVSYSADAPIGFELCGDNRNSCRYATARLSADGVRLAVPPGAAPTRVRYCWADHPICTLFDEASLPAGPFEVKIQP